MPPPQRRPATSPRVEVSVGVVSAAEVCAEYHFGMWPEVAALAADFTPSVVRAGYTPLAVTTEHAQAADALPFHHRDPFDRMLIAQALAERVPLVTNETLFDRYGVRRVW